MVKKVKKVKRDIYDLDDIKPFVQEYMATIGHEPVCYYFGEAQKAEKGIREALESIPEHIVESYIDGIANKPLERRRLLLEDLARSAMLILLFGDIARGIQSDPKSLLEIVGPKSVNKMKKKLAFIIDSLDLWRRGLVKFTFPMSRHEQWDLEKIMVKPVFVMKIHEGTTGEA